MAVGHSQGVQVGELAEVGGPLSSVDQEAVGSWTLDHQMAYCVGDVLGAWGSRGGVIRHAVSDPRVGVTI